MGFLGDFVDIDENDKWWQKLGTLLTVLSFFVASFLVSWWSGFLG